MTHSLFISDLHLAPDQPGITQSFLAFIQGPAAQAEALYILGDLFEYWIGDDDLPDPFNASIVNALRTLPRRGVALKMMRGNRDVLLGNEFARACNASLIPDPTFLDLYGTPTLLMHGDTLCTDDVEYLKWRAKAHNPEFQKRFLAQPIPERKRLILGMRQKSEEHKQGQAPAIMDVAVTTVEAALRESAYPRLIHGHTHRPAEHRIRVKGSPAQRIVLAQWERRGSVLVFDGHGHRIESVDA